MKIFQAVTTVGCMALMSTVLAPNVKADDWNRKTTITFSGPVEIPGVHLVGWGVLPAGTYVFKTLDSQSDRHIVQIFSKDERTVYATVINYDNLLPQVTFTGGGLQNTPTFGTWQAGRYPQQEADF